MWIEILTFAFLGICAVYDGMEKEIPLAVVWMGIVAAIVLHLEGLAGDGTWKTAVLSVIPGAIFWMIGFISGERVGYGDGWMLVMIGLFMGFWQCFLILIIGLISGSIVVLLLFAFKKVSGDYQLPFAPFLLFGLGVVVCL